MVNFKIIKTEERNNKLLVSAEVNEKEQTFQFPILDSKINPDTQMPMFVHKIKTILERTSKPKKGKNTKKFLKSFVNLEFDTENVADLSRQAQKEAWRQMNREKGEVCHEKLHPEENEQAMANLKAKRKLKTDARDKIKFDRQTKDIKDKRNETIIGGL